MTRPPVVRRLRRLFPLLLVTLILALAGLLFWPGDAGPRAKVATAKGVRVSLNELALLPAEFVAQQVALADPAVLAALTGRRTTLLAADPLGSAEIEAMGLNDCAGGCRLVTLYDHDAGGTVAAAVSIATSQVLAVYRDPLARPRATRLLVGQVLDIAAADPAVTDLLGDVTDLEFAMVPMSIWLQDDACSTAWCLDLTFDSPAGDGRVLHVAVNMDEQRVARVFYTRARDGVPILTQVDTGGNELNPNAPRYTDGCLEQDDWSVCWQMTAHDGLNIYDAAYKSEEIFSSSKISQVEVYYPSWPGGYRDEVGFAASVPPKFDTRITDVDGGFEIRQMFTEEFQWPTCVCCYRYEQVVTFYSDGSFENRFVSYGPGCDDLSVYRPFWRIDIDLAAPDANDVWTWQDGQWAEVTTELERDLFGDIAADGELLATISDALSYRWEAIATDPLGLDEGRFFVVRYRDTEGGGPIEAGPADTFEPPRQWVDGELVSGENPVVWYIPFLKTKRAAPWYCMPEPAPDISPCEAILRVVPAGDLVQPAPTPTPAPDATATATAPASPEPVEAAASTPAPLPGTTAEEIIANAGCGACHQIGAIGEAHKVGPDLSNIGNEAANRVPDLTAEEYLRQSLLAPNAYIAPECPNGPCTANAMPSFAGRLTETQLDTLIDFLLTMRSGPAAAEATIGSDAQPTATATAAGDGAGQSGTSGQALALGLGSGALLAAIVVLFLLRRRVSSSG